MLSQIESHYDPEFDMTPGGPRVTWAENDLYHALLALTARVEALEAENAKLKQSAKDAMALASGECLE
jgi:hypothetical protein